VGGQTQPRLNFPMSVAVQKRAAMGSWASQGWEHTEHAGLASLSGAWPETAGIATVAGISASSRVVRPVRSIAVLADVGLAEPGDADGADERYTGRGGTDMTTATSGSCRKG
jgi:hypothetical protein